jgi:predicted PurR-regulated permease PerM
MTGTELNKQNPVTKATIALVCIALLIAFTVLAKAIVIPVLFAILIGIVLRPVEKFFNQKLRIPRVIAILLTVFLFMLLISGLVFFITYELTRFGNDLPELKKNLQMHLYRFQAWLYQTFHIQYARQQAIIDSATSQSTVSPMTIAQRTMSSVAGLFTAAVVVPVLLFLVMYYRTLFLNFLLKVFGEKQRDRVATIIYDGKYAMQGYIAGLFLEMITVSILQTTAMWIVGIEYFVFIGLITGVLNMIPYIGIMIAGSIGILVAMATGAEPQQVLFLILGFATVQFIDNNILLPKLVGHRVRINAFFSIAGVIGGGIIAGVAGMFLAIPLMALMKVTFDNIPNMKPWGELMGDEMQKTVKWKKILWPKID